MAQPEPSSPTRTVPIRRRSTRSPAAFVPSEALVYCVAELRTRTLAACRRCAEHVEGPRRFEPGALSGQPVTEVACAHPLAREEREELGEDPIRVLAERTPVLRSVTLGLVGVPARATLEEVADVLVEREIGGVPVMSASGEPLGIVSKTDLVRAGMGVDPAAGQRGVGGVMTRIVARLPTSASVADAARLLGATGIHRALVVPGGSAPPAILTTVDVLRWLARARADSGSPPSASHVRPRASVARQRVASLLSSAALCVREDLGTRELAAMLLEHGISGAPVVDEEGRSLGVVSKTDLVEAGLGLSMVAAGASRLELELNSEVDLDGALELEPEPAVGDLMTRHAISVREDTSVLEAAAIMVEQAVHRLPVVTDRGEVLGILTALDVVRWLAPPPPTSSPPLP